MTFRLFCLGLMASSLLLAMGCSRQVEQSEAVALINVGKYQEAMSILRESARRDEMSAYLLGELFATGRGVQVDRAEAERWFAAADQLSGVKGKAAYDMAWEFMHGALGAAPNYEEAVYWIGAAATTGHSQATALNETIRSIQNQAKAGGGADP